MSKWTKQRLERMIVDGVEENLSLDYKRADSLAKTDGKTDGKTDSKAADAELPADDADPDSQAAPEKSARSRSP